MTRDNYAVRIIMKLSCSVLPLFLFLLWCLTPACNGPSPNDNAHDDDDSNEGDDDDDKKNEGDKNAPQ